MGRRPVPPGAHARSGYAQARLGLGTCLLELGRWDEAIECPRTVVNAAPQLCTRALQTLDSAGRGRFWHKPSTATDMLRPK